MIITLENEGLIEKISDYICDGKLELNKIIDATEALNNNDLDELEKIWGTITDASDTMIYDENTLIFTAKYLPMPIFRSLSRKCGTLDIYYTCSLLSHTSIFLLKFDNGKLLSDKIVLDDVEQIIQMSIYLDKVWKGVVKQFMQH